MMYLTRYSLEKYNKYQEQNFLDYLVTHFGLKAKTEVKLNKEETYFISNPLTYKWFKFILKCKPLTVHKAKWLEADYVVVDYVDQNNSYNFPSSFEDDPVLDLLLENVKNSYLYSEERRLFYVSMTRWKKLAMLIYSNWKQSLFLKDLLKLWRWTVKILNQWETSLLSEFSAPKCNICGWMLRVSKFESYLGPDFTEFYCSNKEMWCETKYQEYNWKIYITPDENKSCPKCWSAMELRKRKKDWVTFWWCTKYPDCNWWRDFEGYQDKELD